MAWLQLLLVLGILTSGCGQVAYQRFDKQMWANYIHVNELKKGMSQEEVTGIMGPPGIRESGDYRGGHYTIYFYLTHSMDFENSNTVRSGYTPLVFKNDRLVGIGRRDYRGAVDRAESETQGMPKESLPWGRTH
jgi:outer membrane protein assembly factor BamE (lipoprotein component of BamABCDE complex)